MDTRRRRTRTGFSFPRAVQVLGHRPKKNAKKKNKKKKQNESNSTKKNTETKRRKKKTTTSRQLLPRSIHLSRTAFRLTSELVCFL